MTKENEAILNRFPEGSLYFLPLYLAMMLKLTKEEVFGLTIDNVGIKSNAVTVDTLQLATYNRITNDVYFKPNPNCRTIVVDDPDCIKTIVRAVDDIYLVMDLRWRVRYMLDKNGKLTTFHGLCGGEFCPLMCRKDGSYISPQGINYVTRVIQGKTSSIEIVQPHWRFNNLAIR